MPAAAIVGIVVGVVVELFMIGSVSVWFTLSYFMRKIRECGI